MFDKFDDPKGLEPSTHWLKASLILNVSLNVSLNQKGIKFDALKLLKILAPQVGLEPTTLRLTAECSAIELLRNICFATRFMASARFIELRNSFHNVKCS